MADLSSANLHKYIAVLLWFNKLFLILMKNHNRKQGCGLGRNTKHQMHCNILSNVMHYTFIAHFTISLHETKMLFSPGI